MAFEHYDKCALLLSMDGANNGTAFPDWSPSPKTVTRTGAVTSTAQYKYYGSSGFFNGSTNRLTLPSTNDILLGSSDYTVGIWVYPTATPGASQFPGILSRRQSYTANNTYSLYLNQSLNCRWAFRSGGNGTEVNMNIGTLILNAWNYVEVGGNSSDHYTFLDGVLTETATRSFAFHTGGSQLTTIGMLQQTVSSNQMFQGYLSDLCVIKGHCRNTANFTPPTRLIGELSNTNTPIKVEDELGDPVVRRIIAVPRGFPSRVFSGVSDALGEFTFRSPATESSVIALHEGTPIKNDLIARVIPV